MNYHRIRHGSLLETYGSLVTQHFPHTALYTFLSTLSTTVQQTLARTVHTALQAVVVSLKCFTDTI
jgi:hypothetical protein